MRAGDTVKKGQVLAALDSPALGNEYQRERATLEQPWTPPSRASRSRSAARSWRASSRRTWHRWRSKRRKRELARNQWAWDQHVIPERDYKRAQDDVATAQLNYDHARDSAGLERDSLALDLRTKRLERDRQALVVESLKQRVAELTVRSPVAGTVANLAVTEKSHVAADAALITVVDLSAFEIEFQVAESYAGEIKPGMAAAITLEGRDIPRLSSPRSPPRCARTR